MAAIRSFQELRVWQLSMELADGIYLLVRQLPPDERFELSAQLRRAAVSTPANIAEGFGYGTNRRYVHHLRIALGSNSELATHLMLAERAKLLPSTTVGPSSNERLQSAACSIASSSPWKPDTIELPSSLAP